MRKKEEATSKDNTKAFTVIEREIIVDGTKVNLKSIFTGQRRIEDALENIIKRKMEKDGLKAG